MLNVERFRGEDEAVRLANATVYGLTGVVWATDEEGHSGSWPGCGSARSGSTTATRTCRGPSGVGSSSPAWAAKRGPAGLAEYREAKHIWRSTHPSPQGWFALSSLNSS